MAATLANPGVVGQTSRQHKSGRLTKNLKCRPISIWRSDQQGQKRPRLKDLARDTAGEKDDGKKAKAVALTYEKTQRKREAAR